MNAWDSMIDTSYRIAADLRLAVRIDSDVARIQDMSLSHARAIKTYAQAHDLMPAYNEHMIGLAEMDADYAMLGRY